MDDDARPLSTADTLVLMAVLASLEGAIAADALPNTLTGILTHHLERNGLLTPHAERHSLLTALHELSARVRATLA
ncbi:hypothetical protein [Rathayibacter toxicus]|uniref:Uncharacterized protein n=1 Tax=Rathayibacter toxicus TaxID=145458 RepID=A0A0C5BTY8_9MICO|nr:hypothetical protein [Rathayibacter toxicus]AJM78112.1 hypothetical protein TI83_09550 [Rathayibacter toxicus]ALS57633.1 hypothetical protein APU90_07515 [Rathayibacter toxicus]KKM44984.1 hypothetical protein VT73_07680 [Rathayibacter toxicus]PPG20697.1 hypothetical protein C5D15_09410 [Rathayibacter toxicus]PPG45801.1 hypothetical protein C5D16_09375 [Rathayibacter toxicus]